VATTKLEPVNLGSVARGALMELFARCANQVAANIDDKATVATATREITLKIKFKPDGDRRAIEVSTSGTTKLAAAADHSSRLYTGRDDAGKTYLFDQDPRQELLFKPEEPKENLLAFDGKTQAAGS
jgi:hypothetical protein